MCKPTYFSVDYVINPWMTNNIHQINRSVAKQQWQNFYQQLQRYIKVKLIEPEPNLPDYVFTANGGLVNNNLFILSHFRYKQRQAEAPLYKKWFETNGYQVYELPKDIYFEGAGDGLIQPSLHFLWMGYNFRSDLKASQYLKTLYEMPVIPLKLINAQFYHLDTCLCPLLDGWIMYYPNAFDVKAQQLIEQKIDRQKRIIVSEEDATNFACNAVVIKTDKIPNKKAVIFINSATQTLQQQLNNLGYKVIIQPVTEFNKAGGANKCLVLEI